MKRENIVIGTLTGLAIVAIAGLVMTIPTDSSADSVPIPTPTSTYYLEVPVPVPGPTVTVTAKPEPRPTKTIYVERSQQTSRSYPRPTPAADTKLWAGATSVWDSQSPKYVARAVCIVHHESWSAGTYKAENPTSTASGVGQWVDATWLAHAKYAGIKVVPHASNNSPTIQDRVLVWGVHHGMYAWAHNCS